MSSFVYSLHVFSTFLRPILLLVVYGLVAWAFHARFARTRTAKLGYLAMGALALRQVGGGGLMLTLTFVMRSMRGPGATSPDQWLPLVMIGAQGIGFLLDIVGWGCLIMAILSVRQPAIPPGAPLERPPTN